MTPERSPPGPSTRQGRNHKKKHFFENHHPIYPINKYNVIIAESKNAQVPLVKADIVASSKWQVVYRAVLDNLDDNSRDTELNKLSP